MPTAVPSWLPLASFAYAAFRDRLRQLDILVVVFDRVLELLPIEERPIPATSGEQLVVTSLLDDLSALEHDDPARVANCADAMRRDERRAARQCCPKRVKDLCFGVRIDR